MSWLCSYCDETFPTQEMSITHQGRCSVKWELMEQEWALWQEWESRYNHPSNRPDVTDEELEALEDWRGMADTDWQYRRGG